MFFDGEQVRTERFKRERVVDRSAITFGTVQSNTAVPDGTSTASMGINALRRLSVSRTPSPVMLRQIGNRSEARACMSWPEPPTSQPLAGWRISLFYVSSRFDGSRE
jgi:hypothetical protein